MKAVCGSIRWWANFTAALCAWKLFSLYSCLGNKDKLLCGCNTRKKADNKNAQRHAWTHMYKKAETVMHKTHREVITQNVLDPIETDFLCFSNESKALSRQAPSCSVSGACLHTWSCTSGYLPPGHTLAIKRLGDITEDSFYICSLCFCPNLSTLSMLLSLPWHSSHHYILRVQCFSSAYIIISYALLTTSIDEASFFICQIQFEVVPLISSLLLFTLDF